MKNKVIATLQELGFVIYQSMDSFVFEYEGKYFMYINDDKDKDYMTIIHPYLIKAVEGEEGHKDKIVNLYTMQFVVNSNVKYVKAYVCGESLWLAYEHEFNAQEDLGELITKMIRRLFNASEFVRRQLEELYVTEEMETNNENDDEPPCPHDVVDFDYTLPEDIFDVEGSENE